MILCTFLMSQVPEVKEAATKYSALSGNRRASAERACREGPLLTHAQAGGILGKRVCTEAI